MKIVVKKSELHGRGVFAKVDIEKDEIIEECHVILIPIEEEKFLDKTFLYNYYFEWDKNNVAIILEYGSIYNHSHNANAEFDSNTENKTMILTAARKINKGEEITVNYNGDYNDNKKVWFEISD